MEATETQETIQTQETTDSEEGFVTAVGELMDSQTTTEEFTHQPLFLDGCGL